MSYSLKETPGGIELDVAASGRESLIRESLNGALEALYGREAGAPAPSEEAMPLQAAGVTLAQSLPELLGELLDVAPRSGALLGAPRWLAFDEGRVTATLPVLGAGSARRFRLISARVAADGARFVLSAAPAR
jgi:hypothetical protein